MGMKILVRAKRYSPLGCFWSYFLVSQSWTRSSIQKLEGIQNRKGSQYKIGSLLVRKNVAAFCMGTVAPQAQPEERLPVLLRLGSG